MGQDLKLAVAVAGAIVLAALLPGCGGTEPTPAVPGTASANASATPSASPSCPPPANTEPTIPGLPSELQGTWKDSLTGDCFSFNELAAEFPDVWISGQGSSTAMEPAWFEFCFVPDGGDGHCPGVAVSSAYEYFPPGMAWDCQVAVDRMNAEGDLAFTTCDPDYTYLHDSTRPRLRNVPNHQMNDAYIDSPPYYRVGD